MITNIWCQIRNGVAMVLFWSLCRGVGQSRTICTDLRIRNYYAAQCGIELNMLIPKTLLPRIDSSEKDITGRSIVAQYGQCVYNVRFNVFIVQCNVQSLSLLCNVHSPYFSFSVIYVPRKKILRQSEYAFCHHWNEPHEYSRVLIILGVDWATRKSPVGILSITKHFYSSLSLTLLSNWRFWSQRNKYCFLFHNYKIARTNEWRHSVSRWACPQSSQNTSVFYWINTVGAMDDISDHDMIYRPRLSSHAAPFYRLSFDVIFCCTFQSARMPLLYMV